MKFVMVPGGWQGGWAFDSVAAELRRDGHHVEAVTLEGLEPDGPVDADRAPNLDTHIAQVAEIIDRGDGTPLALCGHSYAGMVIAGVADQLGDRLDQLVFMDAYVPDDGDSCWSLTSDTFRELFIAGARADGRWGRGPRRTRSPRATAPAGQLRPDHQVGWQPRPRTPPHVHQRRRVAGQPVRDPDRAAARRLGLAGSRDPRGSQHRPPRPARPRGRSRRVAARLSLRLTYSRRPCRFAQGPQAPARCYRAPTSYGATPRPGRCSGCTPGSRPPAPPTCRRPRPARTPACRTAKRGRRRPAPSGPVRPPLSPSRARTARPCPPGPRRDIARKRPAPRHSRPRRDRKEGSSIP